MNLGQKTERLLKALQEELVIRRQMLEQLPQSELEFLRKHAFISTIGASTRIENAILTDQEIEWVDTTLSGEGRPRGFDEKKTYILDKLSKDQERSVEEVAGCREMLETIFSGYQDMRPFTQSELRGLHGQLLQYYPPAIRFSGKYKTTPNKVVSINQSTGEKKTVLDPAPPGMITETAMANLIEWYNQQIDNQTWPVVTATEFVFRFLAIHPFQDGNGRLGRGLFLLALLQSNDLSLERVIPFMSIDRMIEQNRSRYYSVLREVSGGEFHPDIAKYDLKPLTVFFIRQILNALDGFEFNRKRYANMLSLSPTANEVLQAFKALPQARLGISQLEASTGLARRTIQYSLKNLVKINFLQHLGKGPQSKYQLVF